MLRFSVFKEKKKTVKAVGLIWSNGVGIFHDLYINVIFKERKMDYHAFIFVFELYCGPPCYHCSVQAWHLCFQSKELLLPLLCLEQRCYRGGGNDTNASYCLYLVSVQEGISANRRALIFGTCFKCVNSTRRVFCVKTESHYKDDCRNCKAVSFFLLKEILGYYIA